MNPKQIEEFFHLSPVQKHLLRRSELSADGNSYLAQFGCYLNGNLDVSAFERAWQKVTNRQPGLRMTFVSGDLKEPVQVVNRNVAVDLEKQDWRNLVAADQERHLLELLQSDRQCGLVLKTPPLWRMTLVRLHETQYYFVWTYHELLFDEYSLSLILNEVLAAYAAILQSKNETLPLPLSFRKYVDWVKKKEIHEAEHYWRNYLSGIFAPTAIEIPAGDTSAQLDVVAMDRLKLLAMDAQLSLAVIVQGAWAFVLSQFSRQSDVLFGSTVSGRPKELHAIDRGIGHFSNTLPLRVSVPFGATVTEYLTNLQMQQKEWHQYEHNSLTQIHDWSELSDEQPLFQSVLVFDPSELETSLHKSVAGLEITPERLVLPNDLPLTVMVKEDANGWQITSNGFCAEPLCFALAQFAHNPQQRLDAIKLQTAVPFEPEPEPEVSLLPIPAEWMLSLDDEQGWVDWLKTERCAHEVFEERVTKMPDAVAVQIGASALTYRELNARANQLARYLHKLNVVPSIPVGICFTPSPEAVVALLGVLKSGGAYFPLDPTLSSHHLQHLIEASSVTILLTQSHLEPKFRTIPLTHIVLCLDSDWQIIAEEERDNPVFQVSDEHPACFLVEQGIQSTITHAQLSHSIVAGQNKFADDARCWFRFEVGNPWHLSSAWPSVTAATVPEATVPEKEVLPDLLPLPDLALVPMPEAFLDDVLDVGIAPSLNLPFEAPIQPESQPQFVTDAPALAPIQQWFFEQHPLEPHHWNISLLVEIGDQLERATLEEALHLVVAQHAALRWRFTHTERGWRFDEIPEAAAGKDSLPFEYVDFSAKWARSQRRAIEETADKLQTSLHLTEGPLWRVAYFDLGVNRAHRLLVIFHHLIGDEQSLRIFLEDFLAAYWQIRRDQMPSALPPHTTYAQWLQAASAHNTNLSYWRQFKTVSPGKLPIDHPDGANTYGQMERVFVSLNSAETTSLLHHVPQAAKATINEIALTALGLALAHWTESRNVLIEVERSARHQSLTGIDVTRTVGWFTSRFPFWLEIEKDAEVVATLRKVQAQLHAIPEEGLSYGWLRYGNNDVVRSELRALPVPQISFKYLDFMTESSDWHLATETVGAEFYPQNDRSSVITVTGAMNLNMLEFQWSYARAQFEQRTIGVLVNSFITELRRLIHQYSQQSARGGD
ncbi:MAG: AMP-binding protein [Acidobacteria bacterium]|nr:AMP-binding protein [Acidobacteriota bacterium]